MNKTLFDKFIEIPVDNLVEAKWNYKKNDSYLLAKLKNNIKKNGQIENIIVREIDDGMYEVVNGNHRLYALRDLLFKVVVCYNLGKITDAEAKRIAIETNETKFLADKVKLADILNLLSNNYSLNDLNETLPYKKEDIEDLTNLLKWNWDKNELSPSDFNEYVLSIYITTEEMEQWNKFCENLNNTDNLFCLKDCLTKIITQV